MDRERLRATLQRLHSELERIDPRDERERALLASLEQGVRELLASGEEPLERHAGLSARLQEAREEIEARHPTVTLLMSQVADALAKLGI